MRTTLTYWLTSRFSAGVEYNPRAGRVSPLANLLAIRETGNRPALVVGTSSDRIGTPSGQAFYATLSKNLKRETGLPIAPYGGVVYGTYEGKVRPIGGLNVGFSESVTSLLIFDGVHVHPTFNVSLKSHNISFLLIRGRDPGLSYSVVF
ncbi:MAG: hypothetical protein OXB98_12505 [Bryobacterales bacterium]|nr:hypothetical protein [Bryobacterales bacterium]